MPTASSHSKLQWPRSDGDPSMWPTDFVPGGKSWHIKIPKNHAKWKLYQQKVGQHLAEKFGIPGKDHWIDMPEGYYIFIHAKPQEKDGTVREDTYMFGSTNIGQSRFRSPSEFFPHAEWLFDTSKPLSDHSQCGCKYNSVSKLAQEKKNRNAANAAKRPGGGGTPNSKRPKNEDPLDAVVAERAIDARSQRRFRKGELVWFKIDPIKPPKGSSYPEITHWPGLIASLTEKQDDGDTAHASAAGAWSAAGGVVPPHLRKVKRTWEHSIRPLGMFSNSYEVKRSVNDVLPWSAGLELLGGKSGWDHIFEEGARALREGAVKEAKSDAPKKPEELTDPFLEERWKSRWGERKRFADLGQNWDMATLRLSVALKTAEGIASSWAQTDRIEVLPAGSTLSPEEVEALENRRTNLFQGLWFQGERIWLDDMVRLRKQRADLPEQLRGTASPGAESRAVFLQIRLIALEAFSEPDMKVDAWRCLLYGDLYELAPKDFVEPNPPLSPVPETLKEIKAPTGFKYRRLNPDGYEVTVDVFDLAGRCYPDLIGESWFANDGSKPAAGENTKAIAGLRAGAAYPPEDCTWKEDLYVIVRDATAGTEREAREAYARALAKEMGWAAPKQEDKPAVQNGH